MQFIISALHCTRYDLFKLPRRTFILSSLPSSLYTFLHNLKRFSSRLIMIKDHHVSKAWLGVGIYSSQDGT